MGAEAGTRSARRLKTALAVAAASALMAALTECGQGDGVRTEQSAAASLVPQASQLPASPMPTESSPESLPEPDSAGSSPPMVAPPVSPPGAREKLDIVGLLKADGAVGPDVKQALRPCPEKTWPIDVSYGRLTDQIASDVVVNVSACADGKGVGSYVYQQSRAGRYVNVFADEEPGVFAETKKSALLVYQEIYLKDDPDCCPSGEDVVTYVWQGGEFTERDRTYSEFPQPIPTPSPAETTGTGR